MGEDEVGGEHDEVKTLKVVSKWEVNNGVDVGEDRWNKQRC